MKDKYIFIIILIVLLIIWKIHNDKKRAKQTEHMDPITVSLALGLGLGIGLGTKNKARIKNTMKNKTIYKSDLEAINSVTNNFVSSVVMSNAANCFSSSSQYEETKVGDITIAGKNQDISLASITEQDSKLSLECLQKSIQQVNISNEIGTKIMQSLSESVDSSTMSKLINESEQKNIQGLFANPFASSSSSVNIDVSNLQENTTNRKLSNLISNTVENKVQTKTIQSCFASNIQSINTNIKEITLLGTNSKLDLSVSTKQLGKTLATCKQLTEQTSETTNALMTELGVTIVDDIKITTKTDSEGKASAISKTMGLDGVLASVLSAAGLPSLLSSICIMAICASLAGFMLMGGKPPSPEDLDKLKSGVSGSSSPGKPGKK
jgi:hypothetical protein